MNEQQIVKALNHRRHDWMNDLQLILGYMQLGKLDKLKECVQSMLEKSHLESRWFRIGHPGLVLALFERVCAVHDFEFNIEIGKNYIFKGDDRALALMLEWIDEHIKQLTTEAIPSYNEINVLYMKLEQLPDKWIVRMQYNEGPEVFGQGQLQWNEVD